MDIISSISCPQQPTSTKLVQCRSLNIKSFLNPPIRIPPSSAFWPPGFQIKIFYPSPNSTILSVQTTLQYLYMHLNNTRFSLNNVRFLILFIQIPVSCHPLIHNYFPAPFPNTLNPILLPCHSVYYFTFNNNIHTNTYAFHFIELYPHYLPDIFSVTSLTVFKEPSW